MSKKSPITDLPKGTPLSAEKASALIARKVRPSKYDDMIEAISGLKAGSAVSFSFSRSADVKRIINNLTGALINRGVKAPAGFGFYKSVGINNELVVVVRPRKARKR